MFTSRRIEFTEFGFLVQSSTDWANENVFNQWWSLPVVVGVVAILIDCDIYLCLDPPMLRLFMCGYSGQQCCVKDVSSISK